MVSAWFDIACFCRIVALIVIVIVRHFEAVFDSYLSVDLFEGEREREREAERSINYLRHIVKKILSILCDHAYRCISMIDLCTLLS